MADPLRGLLRTVGTDRRIRQAYLVAEAVHRGQRRANGDPYITHPLAVAGIAARMGAGEDTVCAALLHDVVEDCGYPADAVRAQFGATVAGLVEAMSQKETRARILREGAAAHRDLVVLSLADRLHNLRTLRPLPTARRRWAALDTLEAHVPAARALGLPSVERELEDLAARALRTSLHDDDHGWPQRFLSVAVGLLPRRARARWLEEWVGELAAIPTARDRAGFTWGVVRSVPRLALRLRRPGGTV
jgi:(p)ppGpp synthase/HD superfamily hydrolase